MASGNQSEEYHGSENASTIHGLVPLGGRCVVLAFWKLDPLLSSDARPPEHGPPVRTAVLETRRAKRVRGEPRGDCRTRAPAADGACCAEIPRCRPPCRLTFKVEEPEIPPERQARRRDAGDRISEPSEGGDRSSGTCWGVERMKRSNKDCNRRERSRHPELRAAAIALLLSLP